MKAIAPSATLAPMPLYEIETYGELQPGLDQEWLLTNGLGGYAAGTVVGANTLRYHGLLCAATLPPVGRMMLLNRVNEAVTIGGGEPVELSVNQFPDRIAPRGDHFLRRFKLGQTARWEYDIDDVCLTKDLLLCWQRNIAVLRYTIEPKREPVELTLTPFVSLRDFHQLRREAGSIFTSKPLRNGIAIRDSDVSVQIRSDRDAFIEKPGWWFNFLYDRDRERGQTYLEDLYTPGRFTMKCFEKSSMLLWASIDAVEAIDWDKEVNQRRSVFPVAPTPTVTQTHLARAAGDFVVSRRAPDGSSGTSVIAGYPWFSDWGRDTMISLPGLLLTTGRFAEAGQVLSVFGGYVSDGMVPNLFDDYSNEPHYNTVDASLWFIHAAHLFLKASKDQDFFDSHLRNACDEIIKGYRRGTRFNIHMDPADGLIIQGDATTQLTWMDAKTGDHVHTPRYGKAVEINALWHHALRLMGEDQLARQVAASFIETFWIDAEHGLCDVVNDKGRDESIRPNQIFAVSLPHSPLSADQQRAVVEVVQNQLLTPMGLRTLNESNAKFQPLYTGDQFHRDAAYHNGTIWPWLLGPFLDAYLNVHGRSAEAIAQARTWMEPLLDSMHREGSIGQIGEIYEAQPPHRAVGCFAQAWSVAELLRLAVELEM